MNKYNNVYYGIQYEKYINYLNPYYSYFKTSENERFYHYASVDAVNGILNHTEQKYKMWASHLSFLNDSEEFDNGKKLIFGSLNTFIRNIDNDQNGGCDDVKKEFSTCIKEFLGEAKKGKTDIIIDGEMIFNRNIYIICFCRESNSLNQWKYYGKDSGIALEFNLKNCVYTGICSSNMEKFFNVHPLKVVYDDKEKKKIVMNILKQVYLDFINKEDEDRKRKLMRALGNIYGLCPLFKHHDFKDERECRLLFRPIYRDNNDDVRRLIKYRKRNGILIPYMEIGMQAKDKKSLIESIKIGPGENQELLYYSMQHLALYRGIFDEKSSNLSNINKFIIKSPTPFRG